MDIWPTPKEDKCLAVGNNKDSSSIQNTLDVFLGSWLQVTVTEKEFLPEVDGILRALSHLHCEL